MGGGQKVEQYGSPYGGQAVTSYPQMEVDWGNDLLRLQRDKRSADEIPIEEDIDMRTRTRIINDVLNRIL
jgi:hypothetical protein